MTCFDVLLNLQYNKNEYKEFCDIYYNWYEARVNEVLNERGIARVTMLPDHRKADLIRALRKLYHFNNDTICIALEQFADYCRNAGIENKLTTEAFGLTMAQQYFDEHEVPFMYRGSSCTVNFSKQIDFVSWEILTSIFELMYGRNSSHIKYLGADTQVIVTIYDDFIAPELFQAKKWARGDIFEAFSDWCACTFDDVMCEEKRVTFVPCNMGVKQC